MKSKKCDGVFGSSFLCQLI